MLFIVYSYIACHTHCQLKRLKAPDKYFKQENHEMTKCMQKFPFPYYRIYIAHIFLHAFLSPRHSSLLLLLCKFPSTCIIMAWHIPHLLYGLGRVKLGSNSTVQKKICYFLVVSLSPGEIPPFSPSLGFKLVGWCNDITLHYITYIHYCLVSLLTSFTFGRNICPSSILLNRLRFLIRCSISLVSRLIEKVY